MFLYMALRVCAFAIVPSRPFQASLPETFRHSLYTMKILNSEDSLRSFSRITGSVEAVVAQMVKEEEMKKGEEEVRGENDEMRSKEEVGSGSGESSRFDLSLFDELESGFSEGVPLLPEGEVSATILNGGGEVAMSIASVEARDVSDRSSVPASEGSFYDRQNDVSMGKGKERALCEITNVPGLRLEPDPTLVKAGNCEEKSSSESNDRWALKRADSLRSLLKWNMAVPLGDIPLEDLNELFANLFSRAVKVDGSPYPSATLMNMMNCFNKIIRRASDVRSVRRLGNEVPRDFNITKHPAFAKTRMVLRAAIRKSAKEGINKKREKVEVITEEHEKAVLADIDHQLCSSQGCQKRLAFYCLVRLGIRGGLELWELQRQDLTICLDKTGREYVRFDERTSKNNNYELERYNEEQFRRTYHSYEDDFVMCVKQYLRHMAPISECEKPDLFMGAIPNPVGNVWYNRSQKVGRDKAGGWLRNMLILVGLPGDLFSNRSGRASLVTRLATQGVPDEVGMMVTGHHSVSGYQRYDRTQDLKMEAAVLVSSNPNLNYEKALVDVSRKFVADKIVGSPGLLKPLVKRLITGVPVPVVKPETVETVDTVEKVIPVMEVSHPPETVVSHPPETVVSHPPSHPPVMPSSNRYSYDALHKEYDEIDWEREFARSPFLARVLGGNRAGASVGSSISGSSFQNCNITIKVMQPSKVGQAEEIENSPPV